MSLFGSLQLAGNALRAQQIALQVVGQNIANANTPGYSRSEVEFQPAPTQRLGRLLLGLGVQIKGISQQIDQLLEERLRNTTSDRVAGETQEQTYSQLEAIVGELGDTDLSTSLNAFFSSISEILNQPESVSVRNLAVLQGQTLSADVRRLASRVDQIRGDLNGQVVDAASDINRLLKEVASLNVRIASLEGGEESTSDAVGLRDQRNLALTKLAELVDIRVSEQPSGATNVFVGGDYLVFEGTSRELKVSFTPDQGLSAGSLRIAETDGPLQATAGKVCGLIKARDEVLGSFLTDLDQFAAALIQEFNKVYASGQGLKGFGSVRGEYGATDTAAALDAAGLKFKPVNGGFDLLVLNTQTGLSTTTRVQIDLNGLDENDTTLADLRAALDAVDGVAASIDSAGRLTLSAESATVELAFGNDTSGVLAALGINTFFTGTGARDLGVSQSLVTDPALFAASRGGIDGDTANAVELAAFADRPLDALGGQTIVDAYDQFINRVTQGASVTKAVTEGFRVFEETLRGQQLAISGVNLDEEAVRMLQYQRAYQASARFIATIDELVGVLVNL